MRHARALLAAVGISLAAASLPIAHPAAAASTVGAAFTPVSPTRVLDTRASGRVPSGGVISVPVGDAVAVALNVTVTDPAAGGYLTVWDGGGALPNASHLNFAPGEVASNLAVSAVLDGRVSVYVSAATNVIVDVTGTFASVDTAVGAGRWQAITPVRALDTRGSGPIGAGGEVTVALPIPAGASAAAVTVTATDAAGPGYLSVVPAGGPVGASTVNYGGASGSVRANSTLVGVVDGKITVRVRDASTNVIVDVTGWFTGASAPAGTDGLFVPAAPKRVVDTRSSVGKYGNTLPLPGDAVETGSLGIDAQAALVNVTTTGTLNGGYLTTWPAGTPQPYVSSSNPRSTWDTIAGALVVPVSVRGAAVFTSAGGALIVDVMGTFTGEPQAAPGATPSPRPAPNGAATAEAITRIQIPRLKLDQPVVAVANELDPAINVPFWWGNSALPGDGIAGSNVVLGGHRNTHLAPFYGLNGLQANDEIVLTTADGHTFTYRVSGSEVIQPDEVDRLTDQSGNGQRLVLFTCTPIGSITTRLVVWADQVAAS